MLTGEPVNGRTKSLGKRIAWLFWETLIIVVGVLIALGLNDYWTDRQERHLEVAYLKRFQADLESDREWLSFYLEQQIPRKFAALGAIAPIVRGQEPVPADLETFLLNVSLGALGGVSPSFFVTSTTKDDLTATGNFRLIQDVALRGRISQYYVAYANNHKRLVARTTGYPATVVSVLPSALRDKLDLKAMEGWGIDPALEVVLSKDFQFLLNQEYNLAYFLDSLYSNQLQVIEELCRDLEAHIEMLEHNL